MIQTQENGEKPYSGPDLGPLVQMRATKSYSAIIM